MQTRLQFEESVDFIRSHYSNSLSVAIVLGSGLGDMAESIADAVKISYKKIPFFPTSTVEGHIGTLFIAPFRPGFHVAFLQGRFHYYEGYSMTEVVYPIRVLKMLGVNTLIVTNAAGGINTAFQAGDLMLIEDHINLMGTNPLIGKNLSFLGERFPDMSNAYSRELKDLAEKSAIDLGITLKRGVYTAVCGPSYETPAEIRMIRSLGGDAVGMSTVPEVIAARHMNMQVLGISCITNAAAGIDPFHRLNHEEVLEMAKRTKADFSRLIKDVLSKMPVLSESN